MCPSAPCLCSSQQSRPYSLISSLPERKSWVQLILPNLESLEANNYCRNILSTCMQWTSLQGSKKSLVREISKYHPMYQHATVRQCCVRQEVPRPGSSPRFSPRFDVFCNSPLKSLVAPLWSAGARAGAERCRSPSQAMFTQNILKHSLDRCNFLEFAGLPFVVSHQDSRKARGRLRSCSSRQILTHGDKPVASCAMYCNVHECFSVRVWSPSEDANQLTLRVGEEVFVKEAGSRLASRFSIIQSRHCRDMQTVFRWPVHAT